MITLRMIFRVFTILVILPSIFTVCNFEPVHGNEIPICTNPSGQYSPDIWGTKVVWDDHRNADFDIYMYDLITGEETRITDAPGTRGGPKIWGNTIVWTDTRNESTDIYIYDILTKTETRIPSPFNDSNPVIWGDKVAYVQNLGRTEISMYDIPTGTDIRITSSSVSPGANQPFIWGNRIAYIDWHLTGTYESTDVYVYDITTGVTTLIPTDSSIKKGGPKIWGDKLAWREIDSKGYTIGIHMYDLSTGQDSKILIPELHTFGIWEDRISIEVAVSSNIHNVIVYDLSLGKEILTIEGASSAEMWDNMMVYEKKIGEDYDIYLYSFQAVPEPSPPEAICQDVIVSADSNCTANVSIDDGSFDPDGDSITLTQSPTGPYPKGSTLVTLTVIDSQGASSQCTGTVMVVDQMPPTITAASVNPSMLWPPNHKMVNVTINYNATDNCDPPVCKISSVTSNEQIDNSDYLIVDAHHVQLSADRSGNGNGRIYSITIACTDASGNSSSQIVTVYVPHDQGKK